MDIIDLKADRKDVLENMYSWFSDEVDKRIMRANLCLKNKIVIDFEDISLCSYSDSLRVPLEMFLRKMEELENMGMKVKQHKFFNQNKWTIDWENLIGEGNESI